VIDGPVGETAAHRESAMAAAQHDGGCLEYRRPWLQVTPTVTSVGLVRMSKTAECFCHWATSALMSSAVKSASIW
jgi:hypothetical protein